MIAECKQCNRFRDRLEKVAAATRQCVKDFEADRDTVPAYTELRKEGERIDRMLQRVRAKEKRDGVESPAPVVTDSRATRAKQIMALEV